jgi:EAL and modified HD-GYP domain-containing signal transduction protein
LIVSFIDVVVAREAIYDHDLRVVGYELMFRHVDESSGADGIVPTGSRAAAAPAVDSEQITAAMLFSSVSVGIDRLVGDQLAFCAADRGLLTGEIPITLPPRQTVVQIRADIEIDDEVLAGCRRLALDGYQFAIDDFQTRMDCSALLELASLAKIDVSRVDPEHLQVLMGRCWDYGIKLVARRIETVEELTKYRELGFEYLQGRALSQPRIITGRTLETSAAGRMRIAASLMGSEFELEELENIVKTEPGLIYQLLQLAAVGTRDGTRREVRTLRDALVLVGARRLQSWVALLMLSQPGVTVKEDMVLALTRARMSELLVGKISPWLAGLGFTAGMVSAFDLMLGLPAEQISRILPLADDLREAAFGDTSAVGRLVRDVIDHQNGTLDYPSRSGLTEREFDVASLKSLTWAVSATRELKVA